MTALTLIAALTLSLLVAPRASDAQQTAKVPRIGYLQPGSCGGISTEAFRQGLRELGYVEGQNIAIKHRCADGQFERIPDLVAALVRLPVDVIVTGARMSPAWRSKRRARFPLSSGRVAIRWGWGSSPVSRGREGTSQGCPC